MEGEVGLIPALWLGDYLLLLPLAEIEKSEGVE